MEGVRRARWAIAGVLMVGACLLAIILAGVMDRATEQKIQAEARHEAQQAVTRAQDALLTQREGLELMAHNAAANPPLVAAIAGQVDRKTFSDLFASESWWAPYRNEVEVAVAYRGGKPAFTQGEDMDVIPLKALVGAAVQQPRPPSQVLMGRRYAVAVAAAPVPIASRPGEAVLVLARPFDSRFLQGLTARANGPVLISAVGKVLSRAGSEDHLRRLDRAVEHEKDRDWHDSDPAWAAASAAIAPGIWLWSAADVSAFAMAERQDTRSNKRWFWALSLLFGGLAGALVLRKPDRTTAPSARGDGEGVPNAPMLASTSGSTESGGTPLGRYMLLDRIGQGGMADVFTAVALGTGGFRRSFVVKRLRPEMATNAEAVSQFIDEANFASSLVHPNIVPVFDFGRVGNEYYLAQEYIVGRDLGRVSRMSRQREEGPLSVPAALYIAHEILCALDYAHNRRDDDGSPLGLVHRDVTPENIILSLRGEVKLLDFGIVKAAQGRVTQTDIGLVKGNVDFMSPEQARGRAIDHRADLYSVGLVIYYAVVREPLCQGETLFDRLVKAAGGPDETDLARIAALPEPLPGILRRALSVERDERYATAEEFRQVLAAHIEGGAAQIAETVSRMFGDDLQLEQDRLAAAFPRGRSRENPVIPAAQ